MRTVAWLKKELEKFPDDAECFACEDERVGLVVEYFIDAQLKKGFIYCSEGSDAGQETEFISPGRRASHFTIEELLDNNLEQLFAITNVDTDYDKAVACVQWKKRLEHTRDEMWDVMRFNDFDLAQNKIDEINVYLRAT
jgi:hypothetical protein